MPVDSLQNQIVEALKAKPSQKADELARALGVSKQEINKALYGPLKGGVSQDRNYRWSLSLPSVEKPSSEEPAQYANTPLARLCRYYLACLGYDEMGVSTFLTTKYGDPDYIEVNALPRSSQDIAEGEAARKLLGRKRTERGRYELYFGYPTYLRLVKSRRSDWQGFMVEPILLFPIEQESEGGLLTIDLSFPIINQKPFQALTNAERDMLMNEMVHLEQELGINNEESRIELDEIAMRLQAIRPEWPWKEDIDPTLLDDSRGPIAQINEAGIYNRAVIVMAEKSPFTQGLEKELRDLAQLPEAAYRGTALGRWLSGGELPNEPEQLSEPLIEVLPMNSEQRQAVASALTKPVTIITGPPGTGKSQVVTNLLINAAWTGKRVLFASKNNKAVDVVETRVNALGPRPMLLRVGAQSYQVKLAEYMLTLLSATNTSADQEEFADAKATHERLLEERMRLSEEVQGIIDLRNSVDQLEQNAEEARRYLDPRLFAKALEIDTASIRQIVEILSTVIDKADKGQVFILTRLLWPLLRAQRLKKLSVAIDKANPVLAKVNVSLPPKPIADDNIQAVRIAVDRAHETLDALGQAASYQRTLRELQNSPTLEEIDRTEATLLKRIASNSERLWKLWLHLVPSTMSANERQNLGKYSTLLKMVIDAGNDGQLSSHVYGKYNAMLQEVSHLLPCWAVTSLSAKGRIPFKPEHFDVVVFDEASQCDVASALPLLYRAKSVVIIGDPKQLSHISALKRGQDQALLERYDLVEEFPHWAYSYQSLFGLASTQTSGDCIINLVDHHRSHSDIIAFSNEEFYEGRLRVATRYDNLRSPNRSEPGIRWVDVKGRVSRPVSGGAINNAEVKAIITVLNDLVLRKGYQGSIGVVTPFRAQANAITEAVNRDDKLAAALIQRGFLADTVHKFQGDERDVMIFSPVVSSDLPAGALGFLRSNGNLFNVAITRARAQLIVVGDMEACSACDIGYLSRFAGYVASLENQTQKDIEIQRGDLGLTYPPVAKPELVSDWEKTFYVAAYKAGLRLLPQYPIDKYIVDFLMVDGNRKLVIEIDGERYHKNWTGELCRRDQIRNQRLFELGYDVIRFWVYEVRDDLENCLRRLDTWSSRKVA